MSVLVIGVKMMTMWVCLLVDKGWSLKWVWQRRKRRFLVLKWRSHAVWLNSELINIL